MGLVQANKFPRTTTHSIHAHALHRSGSALLWLWELCLCRDLNSALSFGSNVGSWYCHMKIWLGSSRAGLPMGCGLWAFPCLIQPQVSPGTILSGGIWITARREKSHPDSPLDTSQNFIPLQPALILVAEKSRTSSWCESICPYSSDFNRENEISNPEKRDVIRREKKSSPKLQNEYKISKENKDMFLSFFPPYPTHNLCLQAIAMHSIGTINIFKHEN